MNLRLLFLTVIHRAKQRPLLSGGVAIAVIALLAMLFRHSGPPTQASTFYEVKRGDFLISIVEGGTLEAVNEVSIRNEVEGVARIIYIVPEGTYVKQGDLLVELDSSATQDAVSQQQINVEKAQFGVIQAEQQLEIQKSIVDSTVQAARLKPSSPNRTWRNISRVKCCRDSATRKSRSPTCWRICRSPMTASSGAKNFTNKASKRRAISIRTSWRFPNSN